MPDIMDDPNAKQNVVAIKTQLTTSTTRPSLLDNKLNRFLVATALVTLLMLLISGIGYFTMKKITEDQLSPERIQGMERLVELSKKMEADTANIHDIASVEPTRQQNCRTKPDIGWERFKELALDREQNYALNDLEGRCLNYRTPNGWKGLLVQLHRPALIVDGDFDIVYASETEKCIRKESSDNCLSFVNSHLNRRIAFMGAGFFIQPSKQ